MKARSLVTVITLAVCVFAFTACGGRQQDPAALYSDLYTGNSEYSLETTQEIIARFGDAGLSAVDANNQVNMTNWETVDDFCKGGDNTTSTIYVINDDGSYTQYDLSMSAWNLHVIMQVFSGGENSSVTFSNEYDAVHWSYTEKGYLFFGAEHPSGDFGPWLETAIRVKPVDEDLRDMARKYLNMMGYEDNNLFIENWSEPNFTPLELYDIYEVLTGNISAANETVPAAGFETVIKRYLDISTEDIRNMADYDADSNTYAFSSRTAEAKGSTPDMPYPEVASASDNEDGTVTLLVEAVWPKYQDDRAYVHEVTVRPEGDSFKYVSNRIIENKMGTKWYTVR